MKHTITQSLLIILGCVFAQTFTLQAAPAKKSHAELKKKQNWAFTPNPKLPNVLILGDSISIGYTLQVRALLKDKANVYRPIKPDGTGPVNCSGSRFGLKTCGDILEKHQWDVIHFNWGLHDLKHVKKAHGNTKSNDPNDPTQATPEEYAENLQTIITALKKTQAQLIFATTTPVVKGTLNPLRTPEAPLKYNAVAVKIMQEHDIQVNDLYTFCLPHLKKWQLSKNVHFKPEGSEALAKKVAEVIQKSLDKDAPENK